MQYNAKVNIFRITKTSNNMGGWTEAEANAYTNLPCRIVWKKGSEKILFDKTTHVLDARLYCRVVTITTKDRVEYNSEKYEIVDISYPDNKNKRLTLDLKLIE